MKKLSVMVMAGVMALGMVGCGSTAAEAPAESTAPAAESTAAETTESTVEAQTEATDAQTEAGRQVVVGFDAAVSYTHLDVYKRQTGIPQRRYWIRMC